MSALKLDGLLWLPECVELDTDRLCHSRAKLGHGLLSGEYSKPASAEGEQQPDQKVRFECTVPTWCMLNGGGGGRTVSEDMSWGLYHGPVTQRAWLRVECCTPGHTFGTL